MFEMSQELFVFLVPVVGVLFALGVRGLVLGKAKGQALALLTGLQPQMGGEIVRSMGLLKGYKLDGMEADLRVWVEGGGVSSVSIRWWVEAASPAFESVEVDVARDGFAMVRFDNEAGIPSMTSRHISDASAFRFTSGTVNLEMRWPDFFAWLFRGNRVAKNWYERYFESAATLDEFSIDGQRCIIAGTVTCPRKALGEHLAYVRASLDLHHALICALRNELQDFDLVPFLEKRITPLAKRDAFVPLRAVCKALLERQEPESRAALIKDLATKLHPLVGFGVLDVDTWAGVFRKMSDAHFLFALSEIVDERMAAKQDPVKDAPFRPDEALQRAFREEGARRFKPAGMLKLVKKYAHIGHGFFELFREWRFAGVEEPELCAALVKIFRRLSDRQTWLMTLALRHGTPAGERGKGDVFHPEHAKIFGAFTHDTFDARRDDLLEHIASLAARNADWIHADVLLSQLVESASRHPRDKPGSAYRILLDYGDARVLPILGPRTDADPNLEKLFHTIAKHADPLDSSRGMLSLSAEAGAAGALTVKSEAGQGALTDTTSAKPRKKRKKRKKRK